MKRPLFALFAAAVLVGLAACSSNPYLGPFDALTGKADAGAVAGSAAEAKVVISNFTVAGSSVTANLNKGATASVALSLVPVNATGTSFSTKSWTWASSDSVQLWWAKNPADLFTSNGSSAGTWDGAKTTTAFTFNVATQKSFSVTVPSGTSSGTYYVGLSARMAALSPLVLYSGPVVVTVP